jgi:hypothetical protein
MGQYSGLKEKYGAPPIADQTWQDKVNTERTNLEYATNPQLLTAEYRKLRAEKEEHEEKIKKLNIKIAAHEQSLVSWLEDANLTQFKTDDGTTVFIKDTPYSTVEDRDKFITWIKETGLESLLSVHYQTMNGLVTERLTNGQPVPPGIRAFIKSSINMRKGRA